MLFLPRLCQHNIHLLLPHCGCRAKLSRAFCHVYPYLNTMFPFSLRCDQSNPDNLSKPERQQSLFLFSLRRTPRRNCVSEHADWVALPLQLGSLSFRTGRRESDRRSQPKARARVEVAPRRAIAVLVVRSSHRLRTTVSAIRGNGKSAWSLEEETASAWFFD